MSGVPLIVITADRPPSLRGTGAPQTIDQVRLYGEYVLACNDLVVPGSIADDVKEWVSTTQYSVQRAIDFAGPVHINAPFDEPLLLERRDEAAVLAHSTNHFRGLVADFMPRTLSDAEISILGDIARVLKSAARPVIVCGPLSAQVELANQVSLLADQIGAPILADVASQLRGKRGVIAHYDLALRGDDSRVALAPDVILRIGGLPTSKSLNEWIASSNASAKIGIASGQVADPHKVLTHSVRVDCRAALDLFSGELTTRVTPSSNYSDTWKRVDGTVNSLLDRIPAESADLLESGIVAHVCKRMGSDANLFLSNSMPIRWADMYAGARDDFPTVFVNRGANGIDGIISTVAGVAYSTGRITVCILGDLTFLHDQNGLWRLAAEQVPLKLILLHNDGGGVFHFLPVASHTDHFERLVAMPHGIAMSQLASAHGIRHSRAQSMREFTMEFEACLHRPGPEVLELHTDRTLNHERHQEVVAKVAERVRKILGIM